MIHYLLPAASRFTMDEYFSFEQEALVNRFRVIHFEDIPAQRRFTHGTYVIAGLETATPAMTELLAVLYEQLRAAGCRVLNAPGRAMLRLELLQELHRSGRSAFRAERPGGDYESLRYPVFLRNERGHIGNISPLLNTSREVRDAIGRALVEGHALTDILLVEFCSTADASGVYRKYAAYNVGGRILARCLNAGHQWMLKLETSDFTRELVLEEQEYVKTNPHRAELAEIFALANIDYGQMDYSMKDGRVQTWEINMNPTIGRGVKPGGQLGPRELWPYRNETREFFFDRFREAWAALDPPTQQDLIDVAFDPELCSAAQQPPAGVTASRRFVGIVLRPFKPLVVPLAAKTLGRIATVKRQPRER